MKNVIFYSKKQLDVNSPRLLSLISKTPFVSDFLYFCIDPDPSTKKRNDDLLTILDVTEVPTLIVEGQKYVGQDAFNWVQLQAQHLQQLQQQQTGGGGYPQQSQQQQYQQQQQQQIQPQFGNDIQGFAGMSGRPHMPNSQEMFTGPPQHGSNNNNMPGENGGLFNSNSENGYANPFAPNDISGFSNMTQEQASRLIQAPVHTKSSDAGPQMDALIKQATMERDAMLPSYQGQGLPGMSGINMQQMQIPQMR